MDFFHQMHWPEQIGFTGAGRATTLIDTTGCAFTCQYNRTTGLGVKILRMTYLHTWNIIK
jgi:hypothetical protein